MSTIFKNIVFEAILITLVVLSTSVICQAQRYRRYSEDNEVALLRGMNGIGKLNIRMNENEAKKYLTIIKDNSNPDYPRIHNYLASYSANNQSIEIECTFFNGRLLSIDIDDTESVRTVIDAVYTKYGNSISGSIYGGQWYSETISFNYLKTEGTFLEKSNEDFYKEHPDLARIRLNPKGHITIESKDHQDWNEMMRYQERTHEAIKKQKKTILD